MFQAILLRDFPSVCICIIIRCVLCIVFSVLYVLPVPFSVVPVLQFYRFTFLFLGISFFMF